MTSSVSMKNRALLQASLGFFLVIAFAALPLALRHVRAQSFPTPRITGGPTVTGTTETTATITWQTDIESSSIVQYGVGGLNQEQRNIVFTGPGEDEDEMRFSHSVTLQELSPGTTYSFRVKSDTNPDTTVDEPSAVSSTGTFSTQASAPSCTEDTWTCTAYGTCTSAGTQTRTCTMTNDCPTATTPKPPESQSCTPACTEDTWTCTAYGTCTSAGNQTRTCTMTADCPTAQTPKPPESQACTPPPPACTEDTWTCTSFSACSAAGEQRRTCTMTNDCPTATTPKPSEAQTCQPPAPTCSADVWECGAWQTCDTKGRQTRVCTLKTDCPTATTPRPEEAQSCTPACTTDVWDCTAYSSCSADGSQTRRCTLTFDCPTDTKPKPAESQTCQPATTCTADRWECDPYAETCKADGTQGRTCRLVEDCPGVETPKPPESQQCPGGARVYPLLGLRFVSPQDGAVLGSPVSGSLVIDGTAEKVDVHFNPKELGVDKVTVSATRSSNDGRNENWNFGGATLRAGTYDVSAEAQGADEAGNATTKSSVVISLTISDSTSDPSDLFVWDDSDIVHVSGPVGELTPELSDKIGEWLDETAGATVQDFEKNTENVSGGFGLIGIDPGTQRELVAECREAGIELDRCDDWLEAKYANGRCREAGFTTRDRCIEFLTEENGGTFPGCAGKSKETCGNDMARATIGYMTDEVKNATDEVIEQAVKDGVVVTLPDLVAIRPELVDHTAWYPSVRTGDQQTAPALLIVDSDQDGLTDDLEVRLGLDWRDMDSDDDGVPDGKLAREVLKTYFEKGDRPTQGQFSNFIDSFLKLTPVDFAMINGLSIEQPLGDAGEVDETFTVLMTLPSAASSTGDWNDPNMPSQYRLSDPNDPSDGSALSDPNDVSLFSRTFVLPHVLEKSGRVLSDPNDAQGSDLSDPNSAQFATVKIPYSGQLSESGELVGPNILYGHATPNTTVIVYVYSYIPMVLTTQTDENGNYSYDLGTSVADGEHTVYVAVTDDTGKVTKKSNPLSFFVREAIAASEEEYLKSDVTPVVEPVAELKKYYVLGTIALVVVAAAIAMSFVMGPRRKPSAGA